MPGPRTDKLSAWKALRAELLRAGLIPEQDGLQLVREGMPTGPEIVRGRLQDLERGGRLSARQVHLIRLLIRDALRLERGERL